MSTDWIAKLQVSEPLCSSLLLNLPIFLFSLNWYFLFMSLQFSGIVFLLSPICYGDHLVNFLDPQWFNADAGDAGDVSLIPGWGRSPAEENGNPLQYSRLNNPADRGAGWSTVGGVAKYQTRLSMQGWGTFIVSYFIF